VGERANETNKFLDYLFFQFLDWCSHLTTFRFVFLEKEIMEKIEVSGNMILPVHNLTYICFFVFSESILYRQITKQLESPQSSSPYGSYGDVQTALATSRPVPIKTNRAHPYFPSYYRTPKDESIDEATWHSDNDSG